MTDNDIRQRFQDPEFVPADVDSHFTGILLCNRVPGRRYTASTPEYRIIATRRATSERYIVHFMRPTAVGPSPTAALIAGHDRASIEQCIMDALSRPGSLKFAQRRPHKQMLAQCAIDKPASHTKPAPEAEPLVRTMDPNWPPIPAGDQPNDAINIKIVAEGRIYRMTTREFTAGAWRPDIKSNFSVSVVRHGTGMQRRQVVGDTLESVHEFILCALRSRYIPFWMKSAKPLSIAPELWVHENKQKSSGKKKMSKRRKPSGPRVVPAKKSPPPE
jgi:hypothetical protein